MPNLVLEYNGKIYRFGLHEDKSVTRGKFISVTVSGREYYARYGDTSTPLKIEKEGRTYSVQYEAVDFQTISETLKATNNERKTLQVYFAKGRYKVRMRFSNTTEYDLYINEYGNKQIEASFKANATGYIKTFTLKIGNLFEKSITNAENYAYFTIERIGD